MYILKILTESSRLILLNKMALVLKIVPIILFFSIFKHYYSEIGNDLGINDEILFTIIDFCIEIIISSFIIYYTISTFINFYYEDYIGGNPSLIIILKLFISHMFIGVAATIGYLLFFIPGLLVIALSIYSPVFIIKYGQDPLKSISSSVILAKKKILFTSIFISILTIIFMGLQIAKNKVIGIGFADLSVIPITIDAIITILYTFVYAVIVVMFKDNYNDK